MKKIIFVASGRSFHATRWANALSDLGHEIHFFSNIPLERPLNSTIKVYNASGKGRLAGYFLNAPELRSLIKKIRPDIVHAHYSSGNGILAALALFNLKVPFITSLYGAEVFDFPKKSWLHKFILKCVCVKATRVLSTSRVMAKEFSIHYPRLPVPIVTPFGVDTAKFKNEKEKKDSHKLIVGMVKKLEDKYGVDIFIKAAALIIESNDFKNISFKIVGGGSKERELKSLAEKLGISAQIEFMGWLANDEIPLFLNQLDIFVVPSRHKSESFGVAAVEAQSCGIPIIVSNLGGLPEVIEDGVTGLLVEPEDELSLANAVKKILLDQELSKSMSIAGQKRVKALFDWRKSIEQVNKIYYSILSK